MSPIANMLTQLKNAQKAKHESVIMPLSGLKFGIAKILKQAGFIEDFEKKKKKAKKVELDYLCIKMKYDNEVGVINGIKLISKPSRRVYSPLSGLKPVKNGFGIAVVSTSKGLMTQQEARKAKLGGEVLFEIW